MIPARLVASLRDRVYVLVCFEDESALDILQETAEFDNLWDRENPGQRYSFSFQGRLQTLDHILISEGLKKFYDDFQYAHTNVDYFDRESFEDQSTTDGHAVSDHDPLIVTLDDPARRGDPGAGRGGSPGNGLRPPDDRPGPPEKRPAPPEGRPGAPGPA